MNPQQTPAPGVRVNTFGDDGTTEETVIAPPEEVEVPDAVPDMPEEPPPEPEAPAMPAAAAGAGKYRIGARSFDTQEAALEYARTQVATLETEQAVADAYQQGMRAGMTQVPYGQPVVTPQVQPVDDLNPEELYTDPKAFLDKYAKKIKTETRAEIDQREAQRAQNDAVWAEFSGRHPMLADFRSEVEDYANKHASEVQAMLATRGRTGAYDYIATKIKARAAAIAEAAKPKRELPNVSTTVSPSTKASNVTPKPQEKKPLSMAEQIRSIKKRR